MPARSSSLHVMGMSTEGRRYGVCMFWRDKGSKLESRIGDWEMGYRYLAVTLSLLE